MISFTTSSPSPITNASIKGTRGSGFTEHGPPAMTTGSPSSLSSDLTDIPPRSSMLRMFVYDNSYWSVNPTISKFFSGLRCSSEVSGSPLSRR